MRRTGRQSISIVLRSIRPVCSKRSSTAARILSALLLEYCRHRHSGNSYTAIRAFRNARYEPFVTPDTSCRYNSRQLEKNSRQNTLTAQHCRKTRYSPVPESLPKRLQDRAVPAPALPAPSQPPTVKAIVYRGFLVSAGPYCGTGVCAGECFPPSRGLKASSFHE